MQAGSGRCIGIAPDQIDHIFGEFNQIESAENRRFQGTGLGLAITRRLIDLMAGELWVDSTPGQGSCFGFRIDLPLHGDVLPAAPPIPTRPAADPASVPVTPCPPAPLVAAL